MIVCPVCETELGAKEEWRCECKRLTYNRNWGTFRFRYSRGAGLRVNNDTLGIENPNHISVPESERMAVVLEAIRLARVEAVMEA